MTAAALRHHFAETFGRKSPPKTFRVDAETYANVLDAIIAHARTTYLQAWGPVDDGVVFLEIATGPRGHLMFKNIELLPPDAPDEP